MKLAYRFEAMLTEVVPIGLVPEGIRLDAFFKGSITDGPLSGATLRGIDYLLLRAEGDNGGSRIGQGDLPVSYQIRLYNYH